MTTSITTELHTIVTRFTKETKYFRAVIYQGNMVNWVAEVKATPSQYNRLRRMVKDQGGSFRGAKRVTVDQD